MSRLTPTARRVLVVTALVLGAWAVVIALTGGGVVALGPVRLSSRAAGRPALVALLLLAVATFTAAPDERRRGVQRARDIADQAAPWLAALLALAVGTTSALLNEHVAGGADSSGYLSQSRLWNVGVVSVAAPVYSDDAWPQRGWLVSPLGFAPGAVPDRLGPSYAPGLPWLMALGAIVAGETGRFVWTPIAVTLLVWLTYVLTRRAAPPTVALAAAVLVASSPPLLFAAMQTMSDLTCAALWTLAVVAVMRPGAGGATIAGLAAGLALAVRPNLVPLAALFGLVAVAMAEGSWRARAARAGLIGAPMAAAALAIAVINAHLWGGPFSSGYGANEDLFIVGRASGNLARIWRWSQETAGQWLLVGVATLVPLAMTSRPRVWRLGLAVVVGVLVSYLPYALFEEWWYLRFYLPVWPIAAAGVTAAAWLMLRRVSEAGAPFVVLAAAIALVSPSLAAATSVGTFDLWRGAQRYPAVAGHVAATAPRGTLVLAVQHSGALRYAHVVIGRWDYIAPDALDQTVDALATAGRQVWLVADDFEEAPFRARFAGARRGGLDWAPLAEARIGTARTRVYDLTTPTRAVAPAVIRVGGAMGPPWARRSAGAAK